MTYPNGKATKNYNAQNVYDSITLSWRTKTQGKARYPLKLVVPNILLQTLSAFTKFVCNRQSQLLVIL